VPALLAGLMFGLLWLTGNSWFLLLAGAAIGVFGLGVTSRAQINELTFSSLHEQRVAVGEELAGVVRVSNPSRRTTSPVSLLLHTEGLADVVVYVGPLWPGESADVETRRVALHRGLAHSMQVTITSSPSLGLVRAHLRREVPQAVTIHPERLVADRDAQARFLAEDAGDAVRGPGSDPLGVREWRHGDDHRHVHWRSTARHGRLVVLERGETHVTALRLVLVGPMTAPDFEDALATAAALCDRAMRAGQRVTVAAWLAGGPALALVGSRVELLDWWAALTDVVLPDPRHLTKAAATVLGGSDVVIAGPSLILRRLEAGA
jgi:uncharacterized protein (DUF58 family)